VGRRVKHGLKDIDGDDLTANNDVIREIMKVEKHREEASN